MKKTLLATLSVVAVAGLLKAQTTVTITDADLTGGNTYNWVNTNVYLLDGPVFLEAGATLNIQAGTVIKGKSQTAGNPASALFICRGANINATGTSTQPIIFTAEADDLSGSLDETDRGLWGGLVILGYGRAQNNGVDSFQVEGVAGVEPRALMGGYDNTDNSGTLQYVSIRHAGFEIGPGNELNGLTLGAVGSGTVLEHIEVFACSDDGFEFFGGAPQLKWAVSAFNSDDAFDWDTGFRGKGQFWFCIQANDEGNHMFEVDGAIPDGASIWSKPTVYNATLIGSGETNTTNANNTIGMLWRDATGGFLINSIIYDYAGFGVEVENLAPASGIDSYERLVADSLGFYNNVWFGFGKGNTLDTAGFLKPTSTASDRDPNCDTLITHLTTENNSVTNPGLISIGRTQTHQLDPRPDGSVAAITSNLYTYAGAGSFFTAVTYKGAFDPSVMGGQDWLRGWTTLDLSGYLVDYTSIEENNVVNNIIVYPNPAQTSTNIAYVLNENSDVTIEIFDMSGKLVSTMNRPNQNAGNHNINISVENMTSGMYFVNLTAGTYSHNFKLSVVK